MTQRINTLADVAQDYDAIVFDQWGVLHNGTAPYSRAIECLTGLANAGLPLAVYPILENAPVRTRYGSRTWALRHRCLVKS